LRSGAALRPRAVLLPPPSDRALGVDPVLVLAALRHYLHHPDKRAELADRRALERMARVDLDRD
jgi:hypothetical protein